MSYNEFKPQRHGICRLQKFPKRHKQTKLKCRNPKPHKVATSHKDVIHGCEEDSEESGRLVVCLANLPSRGGMSGGLAHDYLVWTSEILEQRYERIWTFYRRLVIWALLGYRIPDAQLISWGRRCGVAIAAAFCITEITIWDDKW